jgi:DNA-binding SARP family transcriptional activator/Tfp pilus assembly protein PilF
MKVIEGNPTTLQANLMGKLEITVNGCMVADFTTQKTKALFCYLLLENGRRHNRSMLSALFWPDVPEQTALHNLRQALSSLRKIFGNCTGGELLDIERDSIGFENHISIKVDAQEFETQMRVLVECYGKSWGRGFPIHQLRRVLRQYSGELLGSFTPLDSDLFEDWLMVKRESLNRLAVEGAALVLSYYEVRKNWSEARSIAEWLIQLAPWDEDAHYRLIKVLLQLGQGNAALAHFQYAIRYFSDTLGVNPGTRFLKLKDEIQDLRGINQSDFTSPMGQTGFPRFAIPFIGRETELETLESWVSDPFCRVVTIIGPSGSGKTRLATELMDEQRTLFRDGVFFAALSGCTDREQMASAILGAVGNYGEFCSQAVDEVLEWSENRKALLVLDNVEYNEEAALLAAQITESAAGVVLVVTAHKRLDLVGEKVYALGGLSTDGEEKSDAVCLFFAHIQSESQPEIGNPDFLQYAIHICNLMEGFPLAIDLAAGQAKRIPIEELHQELKNNLAVLCSQAINLQERHRSILAAFGNTWHHLSARQKEVLSRLTIFEDPFTPMAVFKVCGSESKELCDLANQSLLMRDQNDLYRFHHAVKLYVKETTPLSDVAEKEIKNQHAVWFHMRLLSASADSRGKRFLVFLKNVEMEFGDFIKSTKQFIDTGEWQRVQEMIKPLSDYFEGRGLFREGALFFDKLAQQCSTKKGGEVCSGMLDCRSAAFGIRVQIFDGVYERIQRAMEAARNSGNQGEVSCCLNAMATYALVKETASKAKEYAKQALEISQEIGDKEEEAHSLYILGSAEDNLGEVGDAEKHFHQCLKISEKQQDLKRLTKVWNTLAGIACRRPDWPQALAYYTEALKLAVEMKNRYKESLILNNIGTIYTETKQFTQAEEYFQKSLIICREIGDLEGEVIALSNLGEVAVEMGEYGRGIEYNLPALKISLDIGSEAGEMSTRIILARSYHGLGETKKAVKELIPLLTKAQETESYDFFHRGVVEACQILFERGYVMGLEFILSSTLNCGGADETTHENARKLLSGMGKQFQNDTNLEPRTILDILMTELLKI